MQTLRISIAQKSLLPHLTTKSAVLHAAEKGPKVGPLKLVDPDTTGLETAGDALSLGRVGRVHRSAEAGVGEVGAGDDIVFVRPGEDGEDGAYTAY